MTALINRRLLLAATSCLFAGSAAGTKPEPADLRRQHGKFVRAMITGNWDLALQLSMSPGRFETPAAMPLQLRQMRLNHEAGLQLTSQQIRSVRWVPGSNGKMGAIIEVRSTYIHPLKPNGKVEEQETLFAQRAGDGIWRFARADCLTDVAFAELLSEASK